VIVIWSGVFAGLVITDPGKVGGVAGPVASGFAVQRTAVIGLRLSRSARTAAGSWEARSIRVARRAA
jgi:hypothetical protein